MENWTYSADVVIAGAGAAGLAAAIAALDHGASVIVIDENYDIGGHAMLSGGRIHLGGGNSMQKQFGIEDSADQIFRDWVGHTRSDSRYNDRNLVRRYADECVPMFEFLVANGVKFTEGPVGSPDAASTRRGFIAEEWPVRGQVVVPGRPGSGVVRPLEHSARTKGAKILLSHKLLHLVRAPNGGSVLGLVARAGKAEIALQAQKGIVLATGGHSGNVNFRRMFDPRLTEEYEHAGAPWSIQGADGELAAMEVGASLWAAGTQTNEVGVAISKTRHIGTRWGYISLYYDTDSTIFDRCKATGLTVADWQDVILVNQFGRRFWNETDNSFGFINAALANHGDMEKLNGGGPVWAIFDSAAARRRSWNCAPPNVDGDGYFYKADTIYELAGRIINPHQRHTIPGEILQETVNRYNSFVASGADEDFGKPTPLHEIMSPPFYAAWATPIVHDSLTGLRTDADAQVIDIRGEPIPGLYCAGESQGGLAIHGLSRALIFGHVAGRNAARRRAE